LTGGGGGIIDDTADTISLDGVSSGFEFTGTNVTFTGIPVFGNVQASNIYVALLNVVTGSIPGFDIPQNSQQINTSFAGGQWYAYTDTNNATIPSIELGPISISSLGQLREIGTNGLGQPLYELHDLRGAFDFLTATSVSGVTIRSTFRATFTLNLRGVGAIPEPGTFALLGGGIAAFAAAAARRRRSS
jgi:hypothetical protein